MVAPDGERLGPYRLLSRLGAGGFGEVHLALDPQGRTVAVKILHPHVAADATALTRLAREVETMRLVQGAHVAEVLDASLEGDRPYLVTRYVQGRPLGEVVAAEGPVTGDDLLRLARGLAEAVAAVHAVGVVHRDLKPANVILAEGEPVVIDFGIAYALDSPSVTASGAVLGTPGYLAPEVLEGTGSGAEADVFAFGATLAYASTARHPYGTGPASAIGYRVVHHPPDLEGVPGHLEPLLRECLLRDPAARPDAGALLARLGADPVVGPPRPRAVLESGMHGLTTREWRPGDRRPRPQKGRLTPEEAHERRRIVLHRRWVVGTGLLVSLTAATAREPLPEVALLLLTGYGSAMLVDAGIALFARRDRGRTILDLSAGAGAVALGLALSTFFSTITLALALGTVVFVLVAILVAG
ncbi:serine/threonine protein kinase [Streptosporangium sp. NBC_01755]|uniref:serine/threonine-protein kinase n=1 Tax=unclassified Streptosporangium TaxID=2632669 RepID=UPI002DD85E25|nr:MULTISPECIES: serine/threonine-protein kinase [unclassified Streptosporangium]WSA26493.1 serine/threonine protein kinase [Streptosporangium sp. NBC_01810]WSD02084.1 serine/threonine protein kinase [Streptosporangium sp. NBC_01755]